MKLSPLYAAIAMLALSTTAVPAIQLAYGQFSGSDYVITFETGSTGLPGVPGAQLTGGDSTFSYGNIQCFGSQYFGNLNGSTYLDIYFTQPQQAVGAYLVDVSPFDGVVGVIEVVYDQSNNVIETESAMYPAWGYGPAFLGIGEPTAQIYRVEWQYIGGGYFGVDNVIFGDAVGLSQMPNIPTGLNAVHQGVNVALSWNAADRASTYNVKRASSASGPFNTVGSGIAGTTYTDTTVANGGTYFYVVTAVNSSGESANSRQAIALVVDHFSLAPVASPQTTSVPFNVSISACDSTGAILTNFSGAALLSAAGDHGNSPLTPPMTTAFNNGQWTGAVTLAMAYPDTNLRVAASSNQVFGFSNPFNAQAPAFQLFSLSAAALLYDPFARRIYATSPASAPSLSNCLVVIEPFLGRVETNYYLGDDPGPMALSSDGQFLYIGFNGANVFRRFNLGRRAIDIEGSLGYDPTYPWIPYVVRCMTALPGSPRSVAILELGTGYYSYNPQVVIFDDDVPRPNLLANVLADHQGTLAAASASRLYAGAPFTRCTIGASGVTAYDSHSGPLGLNDSIKYQRGLLFTASGQVFDPETLAVIGSLPACSFVEPDLAAGRIFTLAQSGSWAVYACDSSSLQSVGSSTVPGVYGSPLCFIRWGTNGLALAVGPNEYANSGNQVFLIRTSLVPSVPAVFAAPTGVSYGSFQLTFAGDDFAPYSIWASSNLADWSLLGAATPLTNGLFEFLDTAASNWLQRFYRAVPSK